jgi:hypothetical protein
MDGLKAVPFKELGFFRGLFSWAIGGGGSSKVFPKPPEGQRKLSQAECTVIDARL